ncbi:hypothetical protein MTO96_013876 [Rhipicephalus appendiculatus]
MKNITAGFNKQSRTEATPTTDSKPEGELQEHTFPATFVKLTPGRAVFLVVHTREHPWSLSTPGPLATGTSSACPGHASVHGERGH